VSLRYHHVSRDEFDALAAGGGGPDVIRGLATGQYSKHTLLLRGVLEATQAVGHSRAALVQSGYDLLAAAQRHDPAAAGAVIQYPSVGAWALRTLRVLGGYPEMRGAEPTGLCVVAAAAAIRAGLPAEIEVPSAGGVVMLPSLGAATADGGTAMVWSTMDGSAVGSERGRIAVPPDPQQDGPGWQALRRLRAGRFDVLLDDLDPFRMPAVADVASRLDSLEVEQWGAALHEAWGLLDMHHPAIAGEVAEAIRVIVPLATPPQGLVSSSSPEAFGALALSKPPDPSAFAVTLTHETQHLKLSALLSIAALTRPDDGRRFYAPWRDDPRPASGLLQGAYAYLGVSGFWRRQRHLEDGADTIRAHAEFARWRTAALGGVETLISSGRLTPAGLDFAQGMARTLRPWQDESVPGAALELARHEAETHLSLWRSANGTVPA
jgi:HEXXH motif-containing protein